MADGDDAKAEAIATGIFARFHDHPADKTWMARAVLVLDQGLDFLSPALKEASFIVVMADDGLADHESKQALLGQRIVVTQRTQDMIDDAPVHEYGIIGLDALPVVDRHPTYEANATVRMISRAITDFDLTAERSAFLVLLMPDGGHRFKRLC